MMNDNEQTVNPNNSMNPNGSTAPSGGAYQNNQGFQGSQNPQGGPGSQAPQGVPGAQTPQGGLGYQSPQGVPGAQNPQGYQGPQGPQGYPGPQGFQGPQGPQGPMMALQGAKKKTGLIAAIIVVVVLIVGALGGYFYYKQTPTYSLKQIGAAIENHDWSTFSQHVDVDQVSEDILTGVVKSMARYQVVGSSDAIIEDILDEYEDEMQSDIDNVSKNLENYIRGKKTDADKNGKIDSFNFNKKFFDRFKYKKLSPLKK